VKKILKVSHIFIKLNYNLDESLFDPIPISGLKVMDLKLYILSLISVKPEVLKVEQIILFTNSMDRNLKNFER